MKKDDKITVIKEYVSNQTTNTFMRHGVEKYFHEYVIVIDDDWYTPCEFISEFGLEDSFGPEYVFEQVVIAVKSSIKWLKKQGFKPDEDSDDESYNLYMMIDFIKNIKESEELFENTLNESNVVIAPWRRETAERLIEEANKIDPSYSFVEYDIGPKKEIKYKIFKNDDEYVGTFDVFTDEPYNSPYRYFFNHANVGGLEFQGMTIDEFNKDFNEFIELDERVGHKALSESSQLFENNDLFDYVLNESSSSLKENGRSLEWLLDKAYVSEYRMVGKNSAEVRVRHTPELLTSESMAARFDEDIPDGYRLEVDYLGEDPILGRNFDIYEVQLVKD